jgi:hypothetical protein
MSHLRAESVLYVCPFLQGSQVEEHVPSSLNRAAIHLCLPDRPLIATLQDGLAWDRLAAPCSLHKVGLHACLDALHRPPCACLLQRKGLSTQQRQAFPASAGGPSPHGSPRRHPWGVLLLEGWNLGRAWCGATSTLQASGLSVSLPFRRAACTLGAFACVELCPLGREGSVIGVQIVPTHAMAQQLPLS